MPLGFLPHKRQWKWSKSFLLVRIPDPYVSENPGDLCVQVQAFGLISNSSIQDNHQVWCSTSWSAWPEVFHWSCTTHLCGPSKMASTISQCCLMLWGGPGYWSPIILSLFSQKPCSSNLEWSDKKNIAMGTVLSENIPQSLRQAINDLLFKEAVLMGSSCLEEAWEVQLH